MGKEIKETKNLTEARNNVGVPCLTLRNNTERPETVTTGTNEMIGDDFVALSNALKNLNEGKWKLGAIPELWDGKTAERIVATLLQLS